MKKKLVFGMLVVILLVAFGYKNVVDGVHQGFLERYQSIVAQAQPGTVYFLTDDQDLIALAGTYRLPVASRVDLDMLPPDNVIFSPMNYLDLHVEGWSELTAPATIWFFGVGGNLLGSYKFTPDGANNVTVYLHKEDMNQNCTFDKINWRKVNTLPNGLTIEEISAGNSWGKNCTNK